jgi:hypothetical protein
MRAELVNADAGQSVHAVIQRRDDHIDSPFREWAHRRTDVN